MKLSVLFKDMPDEEVVNKLDEPITEYGQLDLEKSYTYLDCIKWKFKERVELSKGRIVKMSPSPDGNHQILVTNTTGQFYNIFNKTVCQVFVSPFDVRLPVSLLGKDSTVVQPDLCIICDESKRDKHGCNGAPDLVVEILSLGNSKRDLATKFQLYEESEVKEYWII